MTNIFSILKMKIGYLLIALCYTVALTDGQCGEVILVDHDEEKFYFEFVSPSGLADLNVNSYSYRVVDKVYAPSIYVWSGVQELPDNSSHRTLGFYVKKRSLLRTDDNGYVVEFHLMDTEGKVVFDVKSNVFYYNNEHSDPEEITEFPSFPGAFGFGNTTPGGRGGKVYKVTTLDDYDYWEEEIKGSLRHAVEQEGARKVVFSVSGNIRLKRELNIKNPYLTVAGNTAPFPGVAILGYEVRVRADHVILRYLRIRLDPEVMRERFSDGDHSGWDSANASRADYVIFDHLSGSHSVDETFSFTGMDQSTMSNSIISYSLKSVFHDYYISRGPVDSALRHNFGGLIAFLGKPDRHASVTSHSNVWAHHSRRMPGLSAYDSPDNLPAYIDIRNSIMYNWQDNAAGSEAPERQPYRQNYYVNFIGNYLKPGPNTPKANLYDGLTVRGTLNKLYLNGNIHHLDGANTLQESLVAYRYDRGDTDHFLEEAFPAPYIPVSSPPSIESIANDHVGASFPCRDSIDYQTIVDIKEGTGFHPFVDMEVDESPSLPELPYISHVYYDEDDVFPVWWKLAQGLNAEDRIHPLADSTGDGYTNIEKYMYGLTLSGARVNWANPHENFNPLASFGVGDYKEVSLANMDPYNYWASQNLYSNANGIIIITSESSLDGTDELQQKRVSEDLGNLLTGRGTYWSSGASDERPWLIFAFPTHKALSQIQLDKSDFNLFSAAHDPKHIVVQGLLGWPDHWSDLVEARNLPPFSIIHPRHVIEIDSDRAYPAYRIKILDTQSAVGGNRMLEAKIEQISFR